jgi:hypothetical protein
MGGFDKTSGNEGQQKESYLDGAIDAVWRRDPNATEPQAQDYLKQIIKTVPLFMGGRVALAGAALTHALDQAKPGDDLGTQLLDGSLGAAKGAGTKAMFDKIGSWDMSFVAKGLGMGMTARTLEVGLSRETYLHDGQFSLRHARSTMMDALGQKQLVADAAIAGIGFGALRGMNRAGLTGVMESRLGGTVLAGTVFGGSAGAFQEFQRQSAQGKFDPVAIARESLIHAGIGSVSAAPGGLQAGLRLHRSDLGPFDPAQTKANFERMHSPVEKTAPVYEPSNPNARYANQMEAFQQGRKAVERPVVEYSITGHDTKMIIPKEFDWSLQRLRAIRETASQPMTLQNFFSVGSARLKLDAHQYRGRYLPEDLIAGLDMTPNSSLIKQFTVTGERHPYAHQVRGHGSNGVLGEAFTKQRELVFYKPPRGWRPEEITVHEWAHLQHDAHSRAFAAFHGALKLEEYGWDSRSNAKLNVKENWGYNSEPLLGADRRAFETMVERAPIRSTVMGRALEESLATLPVERRDANYHRLLERAQYIRQHAEPKARDALRQIGTTRGNNTEHQVAGDVVLEYLSGRMNDKRAQEVLERGWQYDQYRE